MNTSIVPDCINYAIAHGPQEDDSMSWCLSLAKWLKASGHTKEAAVEQIMVHFNASDSMEDLDNDVVTALCNSAWSSSDPISCTELMGGASFRVGCNGAHCSEFVQPIVPVGDVPTAMRVYQSDDPGTVGVDDDGFVSVVKHVTTKDGSRRVLEWISDCVVYIHTETIANSSREFIFEGIGAQDRTKIRFSMPAEDLADSRKFKAALINAFGAKNRVGNLTFELVQKITRNTVKRRRLCAPTWVNNLPIIPGADLASDVEFQFLDMIPVNVTRGDLERAIETLGVLLDVPGCTPILVTAILGAPIFAKYFPNDRFGVGLWGRTGSMKTAMAKKCMCVYGLGYNDDANLLKHGKNGSTAVGELEILGGAGFLPQIIDNIKSVDPKDAMQYISVVHAVIEGKDKIRGRKDGGIRTSKSFFCTPIITGEVKPDEASTSARVLNLQWVEPASKEEIDLVQKNLANLPVIGYHWIRYLAETEFRLDGFEETRTAMTAVYNAENYVNSGRLATIYCLLRAAWNFLCESPLRDAFLPRTERFVAELDQAAKEQGLMVSEETEVAKFISGVVSLISTQPQIIQNEEYAVGDKKDVIGRWIDPSKDEEIYDIRDQRKHLFLVPAPTLSALKRLGVFTQIPSEGSMTNALFQAGYLMSDSKNHKKVQQRFNGKRPYGWLIKRDIINPVEPKEKQETL